MDQETGRKTEDQEQAQPAQETPPKRAKGHVFAPFHDEILRTVVAPKIAAAVEMAGPDLMSRAQLLQVFNETNECSVAASTFAEWCDTLGVSFERRLVVEIPGFRRETAKPGIARLLLESQQVVVPEGNDKVNVSNADRLRREAEDDEFDFEFDGPEGPASAQQPRVYQPHEIPGEDKSILPGGTILAPVSQV